MNYLVQRTKFVHGKCKSQTIEPTLVAKKPEQALFKEGVLLR